MSTPIDDADFLTCMRKVLKHLFVAKSMHGMGFETDAATFILRLVNDAIVIDCTNCDDMRTIRDDIVLRDFNSQDAAIVRTFASLCLNSMVPSQHGIVV